MDFIIKKNKICEEKCPLGYYYSLKINQCDLCDNLFQNCNSCNENLCFSCNNGTYLDINKKSCLENFNQCSNYTYGVILDNKGICVESCPEYFCKFFFFFFPYY